MPLPQVSVVEVEVESFIVEETSTTQVLTESVETTSLALAEEEVSIIEVGVQGPPGPAGSGSGGGDVAYLSQLVDVVSAELVYRAEAMNANADPADPVWRVRRVAISYDPAGATSLWASGSDAFAHAWTDRANFTYA